MRSFHLLNFDSERHTVRATVFDDDREVRSAVRELSARGADGSDARIEPAWPTDPARIRLRAELLGEGDAAELDLATVGSDEYDIDLLIDAGGDVAYWHRVS